MTTYLLILFAALSVTLGATPLVRSLARRWGFVAQPAPRGLHRQPMPLLGGLVILIAFTLAQAFLFRDRFNLFQLVGLLLGAFMVSFLGLWDDRQPLRPWVKMAGQAAAALLLVAVDVRTHLFPLPWPDYLLSLLWVVGVTNALNLSDNMDGLSGGIGAVAAAFFVLLALQSGQFLVGALAAALLGACLGFLRYNFNPASIFMGDSGSLFLGFILAAIGIKLHFENVTTVTWMIPILVLGLPLFDTALVVISRLRRGLNPLTTPGRDHLSHRLVALGLSQREAVLTIYVTCGALGVTALALVHATVGEAYLMAAIAGLVALWSLVRLEAVEYEGKHREVSRSAQRSEGAAQRR